MILKCLHECLMSRQRLASQDDRDRLQLGENITVLVVRELWVVT